MRQQISARRFMPLRGICLLRMFPWRSLSPAIPAIAIEEWRRVSSARSGGNPKLYYDYKCVFAIEDHGEHTYVILCLLILRVNIFECLYVDTSFISSL